MFHANFDRRTFLKTIGVGAVGGAVLVGETTANQLDAVYELEVSHHNNEVTPDWSDLTENITETQNGNQTLIIDGDGEFEQADGGDAVGGGTFKIMARGNVVKEGTWEALGVQHWDPYGSAPPPAIGIDGDLDGEGGHLILEVNFEPDNGQLPLTMLDIECFVGGVASGSTHGDEQGVKIGPFTDVVQAATLFHYETD